MPARLAGSATKLESLMREAIDLAKSARFAVAPNPMVAAFLLCEGEVLVRACHQKYGEAHAERLCILEAIQKNIDLSKCELLVTLEPCNHHGKTPPCTDLILEHGIKTVYIGTLDPNMQASGGYLRLQEAGVKVELGILQEECDELIREFSHIANTKLPYTILKLAMSLDGKIATKSGHSESLSCEASRQDVMQLRSKLANAGAAILVGGGTFYIDNPRLTVRFKNDTLVNEHNNGLNNIQPLAAVISSRLPNLESSYYLIEDRAKDLVFFTSKTAANSDDAKRLIGLGVRIVPLEYLALSKKLDLVACLEYLRSLGCYYVLCEGGGNLALSMLEANLVQELQLYIAPIILGDNEARSTFNGRSIRTLDEAYRLKISKIEQIYSDCKIVLIT